MRRYILIFSSILTFVLIGAAVFYYSGKSVKPSEYSPEQKKEDGSTIKLPSLRGKPVFPDDYTLKQNEVPSGFQLAKVDESAKRAAGVTSNPGFITNQDFYKGLYGGADPTKIKSVYGSVYVKPEAPQTELLIFAVQYSSEEDFKKELQELVPSQESAVYIKGKDVLMLIGSDTENYTPQVLEISDKLKKRLDLTEI